MSDRKPNPQMQEQLQELLDTKEYKSQAALSKALGEGWSEYTLSKYLKGEYNGSYENVEKKLEEFLKNREDAKNLKSNQVKGGYQPITTSQNVYMTIRKCHLEGLFSAAVGESGTGKTMAALKYVSDYPSSAMIITAKTWLSTERALLKAIVKKLKLPIGNTDDMAENIQEALKSESTLIIIDEAQNLQIRTISMLQGFVDENANLAICFIGDLRFTENLKKHKDITEQIQNRIRYVSKIHRLDVTEDDIESLFPGLQDKKSKNLLLQIARTGLGIREARNIYVNAVNNENITYEGLKAMKRQQI